MSGMKIHITRHSKGFTFDADHDTEHPHSLTPAEVASLAATCASLDRAYDALAKPTAHDSTADDTDTGPALNDAGIEALAAMTDTPSCAAFAQLHKNKHNRAIRWLVKHGYVEVDVAAQTYRMLKTS